MSLMKILLVLFAILSYLLSIKLQKIIFADLRSILLLHVKLEFRGVFLSVALNRHYTHLDFECYAHTINIVNPSKEGFFRSINSAVATEITEGITKFFINIA